MSLTKRVEQLEDERDAALGRACSRLVKLLTPEELNEILGPPEWWAELSDADLGDIFDGRRSPPPRIEGYTPPDDVMLKLWDLASPAERALLFDVA